MTELTDSQKLYNAGIGYENKGDVLKALTHYRLSAEQDNNDRAQFKLGWFYSYGIAVQRDYKKSFQYYNKSAKQGNLDSKCNLAAMLMNGQGVQRDEQKALELIKSAANDGHVGAQCNLGSNFAKTDINESIKWLTLAASKNTEVASFQAQFKLGCLYENMSQGLFEKPYIQAIKWYMMAAENGHLEAKEKLQSMEGK